jgi:hypothetical protein
MKIFISEKTSKAEGDFGVHSSALALQMEGRKKWKALDALSFETTQHNLNLLLAFWPDAEIVDNRNIDLSAFDQGEDIRNAPQPEFVLPPRNFQLRNFDLFKDKEVWAIFSEQGTGKTKVSIDILCHRWLRRMTTGSIVFSSPKGVHSQWIEQQFPKHAWRSVEYDALIWEKKKIPDWILQKDDRLKIISGNIDMLKSKKGLQLLNDFAELHGKKLLILVDESDSIKNLSSARSQALRDLAVVTKQRAIMTGTPIAKDLTDEWAQFYFLDPDIIGHKYKTSFQAQYCIMGGFENRSIIGHRNLEHFKELTAPHIFRATKKELDLPEKVYDPLVFDLSDEQRRLIRELRDRFFAEVKVNEVVAVKTGATALIRIQQISNGFYVTEDGALSFLPENPRFDALMSVRKNISGPVIVWCRFKEDIKFLKNKIPGAVTYYGEDNTKQREEAKAAMISGSATEMLATAGAAGKGVDGLQEVCSDAIYYSNTFNSIDRWQSEDRIHRMGMKGTATYYDLIARGGIDRAILSNLKRKKDISTLVLDDIRQVMETIE